MFYYSLLVLCSLEMMVLVSAGFLPSSSSSVSNSYLYSLTSLNAKNQERKNKTKERNRITVKEILDDFKASSANQQFTKKKKKYRRSRSKVDSPKQTYMYATQRREMERMGIEIKKKTKNGEEGDEEEGDGNVTQKRRQISQDSPITIARKMGMNPSMQSCDLSFALSMNNEMIPVDVPRILGKIKVGTSEESKTGMYAYAIEKPAGWAILEGNKKKGKKQSPTEEEGSNEEKSSAKNIKNGKKSSPSKTTNTKKLKYYDQENNNIDTWELSNDFDLSSVMTAEELEEFADDGGTDSFNYGGAGSSKKIDSEDVSDTTENASPKIAPRTLLKSDNDAPAIFAQESRPSVVAWLKELKAAEGAPIRGGKNWKAIAGAVDIDDSGLVMLCPKDSVDNIFVDNTEYVAVIGNGKFLAPKGKKSRQSGKKQFSPNNAKFESYAKVRKGRGKDVVSTTIVTVPDGASTCSDVVQLCQSKFFDGIRGDNEANPLERRANRRLVHCSSLTASSLTHDELIECESEVTDDIQGLSERRNQHEFHNGSFLGRWSLAQNEDTNAYREINGAADGWPGWIVDRYDKWLLVQHDDAYPRGPLPSLHDGKTAGVYYFASDADRSITGAVKGTKPKLLEGQMAPEMIEIKENGIKYHVNFDDLSTGIFLDQRNQRAWLARHCTEETRVLNCFAHCGAFSIAAATAGAETVSLDLDKKWLDRIEPQMNANGISDMDRHDCIYGDCKFDASLLENISSSPSTSLRTNFYSFSNKIINRF
jgi:hypothetical protein